MVEKLKRHPGSVANGSAAGIVANGSTAEVDPDSETPFKRLKTLSVFSSQGLLGSIFDRHNFQNLLEPLLRKVVSEEVEHAFNRTLIPKVGHATPRTIEENQSRNLKLKFVTELEQPIYTASRIEGRGGCPIEIEIVDRNTGERIVSGAESSLKLEIVPLDGDLGQAEKEKLFCTPQEFDGYILREREGKRPLLTGELCVSMTYGLGTLGDLEFTDNSSWIRSRKFRLGARVTGPVGRQYRSAVMEAWTDAFVVKDHRGVLYKKHYPPALEDAVWRLDKVGKDGAIHNKLKHEGVNTVCDFLRLLTRDPRRLQNILGAGISNKLWTATVKHAQTCKLNAKHFLYVLPPEHNNVGLVFNVVYELVGIISGGKSIPIAELSAAEKSYVEGLVKVAYKNWNSVQEFDEGFPLDDASSVFLPQPHQSYHVNIFQREDTLPVPYANGPKLIHNTLSPSENGSAVSISGTGSLPLSIEDDTLQAHSSFLQTEFPMTFQPSCSFTERFDVWNQYEERRNSHHVRNEASELCGGFFFTSPNNFSVSVRARGDEEFQKRSLVYGQSSDQPYNFALNTQNARGFMFSEFPANSAPKYGWIKLKAVLKWGMMYIRKLAAANRARVEEVDY